MAGLRLISPQLCILPLPYYGKPEGGCHKQLPSFDAMIDRVIDEVNMHCAGWLSSSDPLNGHVQGLLTSQS